METAVNLILDGAPAYGERGAGHRAGRDRPAGDRAAGALPAGGAGRRGAAAPARAAMAPRDGRARRPGRGRAEECGGAPGARGADLVYELSGDPSALDLAIAAAGHEARIVVGSWYGKKRAPIDLGGRFHRRRLRIVSSQVSHIGAALSARWDRARRFEATWRALADIDTRRWSATASRSRRRSARLRARSTRRSRRAADLADRRAGDEEEPEHDGRTHRFTVGLLRDFVAAASPGRAATGDARTSAHSHHYRLEAIFEGDVARPARVPARHLRGGAAPGRLVERYRDQHAQRAARVRGREPVAGAVRAHHRRPHRHRPARRGSVDAITRQALGERHGLRDLAGAARRGRIGGR